MCPFSNSADSTKQKLIKTSKIRVQKSNQLKQILIKSVKAGIKSVFRVLD